MPARVVKVLCEVKDKQGKIFINDQLAYEASFGASEKIVGLIYRFEGTGSVRGVELMGGDGVGWKGGLAVGLLLLAFGRADWL